jgi:transcriptional regulator with XRE-family HTH domain
MPNFHELMARIGWSDAELSRRLSVRPGTVRDWRTGRRDVPPSLLEWLRTYAEAIDRLPPLPKNWIRG